MTGIVRAFLCLSLIFAPVSAEAAERITIFAAASLKDAMDRAIPAFEKESGIEAVVSLAASSVLARQIEAGAPADIFISADRLWMNWLAEHAAVESETRRIVAGNELVIVTRDAALEGASPDVLLANRFAMGDPRHVPAGRYAEAALSSLSLWETVKDRAVFGENVRVALELARRGEVGAAIVYGSDQMVAEDLVRAYTFPESSHPPVVYPGALTSGAKSQARAFLEFLSSEAGQTIFAELGFTPADGAKP